MLNLRSKRFVAGLAAAAVLATGGSVAFAQMQGGADPGRGREAFLDDVAAQLGVTTGELEQAFRQAALERVDAAVAAGRLTVSQADRLRERIQSGKPPLRPHPVGRPGLLLGALHEAAGYLNLAPLQIMRDIRSGKSLAQIAEEHGKTADGLEQALLGAVRSHLQQAVQAGRFTQAEADQLLSGLGQILPVIVSHVPAPAGR
jgi:hypothetical protein